MSKQKISFQQLQNASIETARQEGQRVGVHNQPLDEAVPGFEIAPCEAIISGDNNTHLVFGRDRPHNLSSGYGGLGAEKAGRIDLIAGLASSEGTVDKGQLRNPSFQNDAARVYISQKSNIDKHMGLAPANISGENISDNKSAVGIKADCVRVHARGDIKLVTGRAQVQNGGESGEKFSTGGANEIPGKIYFIAGNYNKDSKTSTINRLVGGIPITSTERRLQPIPKGDRLAELFQEILDINSEITQEIQDIIQITIEMAGNLAGHIHAPAPLVVAGPSPTFAPVGGSIAARLGTKLANIGALQTRFVNLKKTYLDLAGNKYINSPHVFTT